jgi:hypothetical protein
LNKFNLLWKEAAIWTTVGSASIYLAGSLYLSSYYVRFGMPETEISFPIPYVMSSSLVPLILPIFWLAMVAAGCRVLSGNMIRPPSASAFFPIPAVKAVAYTLSFCAANTLAAVIIGPQKTVFMDWTWRSIVLGLLAIAAFWLTFRRAKRAHQDLPPPRISRGTSSLGRIVMLAVVVGALSLLYGARKWPYSTWQNWFLAGSLVFVAVSAAIDMRKSQRELAKTGEWKSTTFIADREELHPAATIFLSVVAIMALLLQSGLAGTADADQIIKGCQGTKTVQFDPVPQGLANQTYLLVLHQNNRYYVQSMNRSIGMQIVTERPDQVVTLGWMSPPGHC